MTLTRGDLSMVAEELRALMAPGAMSDWKPRFNVAPTDVHVMVCRPDGMRVLERARWGFARTSRAGEDKGLLVNARAETAAFLPTFRDAFVHRRCVVIADGFFEWRKDGSGRRLPLWFHRSNGGLLRMAGLYEDTAAADRDALRRFAVLTTKPNALVARIHDRMPALLVDDAAIGGWLDRGDGDLLRPAPDDYLVATPVSTRVNSVRNDDPGCVEPLPEGDRPGDQLALFG